jgi:hypothetical protein
MALASSLAFSSAFAAPNQVVNAPPTKAATLNFDGRLYVHRWSKTGQNEFTPENDKDLERWHDMVTINVHAGVRNGDQLAELANAVLGNYQKARERSSVLIQSQELRSDRGHLIVALLGNPGLLEAAFARSC